MDFYPVLNSSKAGVSLPMTSGGSQAGTDALMSSGLSPDQKGMTWCSRAHRNCQEEFLTPFQPILSLETCLLSTLPSLTIMDQENMNGSR